MSRSRAGSRIRSAYIRSHTRRDAAGAAERRLVRRRLPVQNGMGKRRYPTLHDIPCELAPGGTGIEIGGGGLGWLRTARDDMRSGGPDGAHADYARVRREPYASATACVRACVRACLYVRLCACGPLPGVGTHTCTRPLPSAATMDAFRRQAAGGRGAAAADRRTVRRHTGRSGPPISPVYVYRYRNIQI